ncbi:hypothetical protein K1719_036992 [Acacia pycnantha]|nr:hypothetical protein K1719_036992 [Acacia pycnantha]
MPLDAVMWWRIIERNFFSTKNWSPEFDRSGRICEMQRKSSIKQDDLKSLQSVGQIIGEVLRPLDNERSDLFVRQPSVTL